MVVVVDYGAGNLESVKKAISFLGFSVRFSNRATDIKKADKLILPGVGDFSWGMKNIIKRRMREELVRFIKRGRPFLGICLGLQLLFEESEESRRIRGLGILKGRVKKFRSRKLTVPHMGWNQISIQRRRDIFRKIPDNSFFYFAHSYYVVPEEAELTAAFTDYGIKFSSVIVKDNIYAVQFHPEKSQKAGLRLLENFLKAV